MWNALPCASSSHEMTFLLLVFKRIVEKMFKRNSNSEDVSDET